MTTKTEQFDLVIVGSGGGGLTAALAAQEAGLSVVVLEKQSLVGGSTAMSGGVVWMPDNPLMRAGGVPDSYDEGMTYLQALVGEPDDAGSTLRRREAFLSEGPGMIDLLQRSGVELIRCEGFSDYSDTLPGGNARGRSVEGVPWDGKQLGAWHPKIHPGIARGLGMAVTTNESRSLAATFRSVRTFSTTTRVVLRTWWGRLRRRDLMTAGMSLIGQMTKILVDRGVPIWLDTEITELVVTDGRVTGVRGRRGGQVITVTATGGVLLAAGGFERNGEMRMKYSAQTQPNDGSHTVANLGNTGQTLEAAIALGAKVGNMDEAVWVPIPTPDLFVSNLSHARCFPHTILVNQHGRRFVNEANSYVEVGKAMYANDGVPCWLVFDDAFRRKYPWGRGMPRLRDLASVLPGRMPADWVADGLIRSGETVEALAREIGVDPATLAETVREFNQHAADGQDPAFGRGESQYNQNQGDPRQRPNHSLGTLARGPFYATQIFPGDVGTTGGVVTDELARVVDERLATIPGLYAAGNMVSSLFRGTYPGAGASIAHSMTFGYITARHVAEQKLLEGQG